jgi:hypothetical protein
MYFSKMYLMDYIYCNDEADISNFVSFFVKIRLYYFYINYFNYSQVLYKFLNKFSELFVIIAS